MAGTGWAGLVAATDGTALAERLRAVTERQTATVADLLDVIAMEADAVSFATVEILDEAGEVARITVAGDVQVDLGGSTTTRFSWPTTGRWVTGEAVGLESVRISLPPRAHEPESLPLANGAEPAAHVTVDLGARHVTLSEPIAPSTTQAEPEADPESEPVAPAQESRRGVDRRPQPLDLTQVLGTPAWTLVLPDGNEVEATSRIVVGRRPWRTDPEATSTYYVLAPSPRREISGKHVEFSVVGDELHATDLDSTNGTLVLSGDAPPRLLHHSSIVSLHQGDTLDLGEGFRIVVGERNNTRGQAGRTQHQTPMT